MRVTSLLDRVATFPIIAAAFAAVEVVVALLQGRPELLPGGLVLAVAVALVRILPAIAGPVAALGVSSGGAITVPLAGLQIDIAVVGAIIAWASARYGGRLTGRITLAGLIVAGVLLPVISMELFPPVEDASVLRAVAGLGGAAVLVTAFAVLWWVGRRSARQDPSAALRLPGSRELDAMNAGSDSAYGVLYLAVIGFSNFSGDTSEIIPIVIFAVAVTVRRRNPAGAIIIAWIGAIAQMGLGQPAGFQDVAILAVLFAVGAYGSRRWQIVGAVSAVVGALVASLYNAATQSDTFFSAGFDGLRALALMFGIALAVLGLSWTAGALARVFRIAEQGRAGQQRAEDARAAAQRELDAVEERNAIARDMHDVVAHSLAVVIAQADGARYLGSAHPEQTDEALNTISSVARDALGDVRQLLAQLRHSEATGPQPGAADLPGLLDAVAASGPGVVRDLGVDLAAVPRGAGLALFRIAQEATTNALRHGVRDAPLTLSLRAEADELVLLVRNRRTDTGLRPGGHGLVGMRERALLAGGSLRAEPDGEDFVVEARLPRTRTEGDSTV
ncbi:hypothetical protein HQQ80_18590 [Microbacteriaceae bacterium VKM Ac-2855]|nr:hypothetical protein [Microbacteriaceae bacterium VKM Ac-2855]